MYLKILLALLLSFMAHLTNVQVGNAKEQKTSPYISQYQKNKIKANSGTIGIITYFTGTYARFGADLSNVLNGKDGLRVLPIMGHGSKQNIEDVLYLKGVDVALVMGDVLNYIADKKQDVDLRKRIAYIAPLYPEEIHLIARKSVKNIQDLAGKKVNFGPKNSGTRITSVTTFNKLKIDVSETNYDETGALQALMEGKISAMVFSDGKPTEIVKSIPSDASIKLLEIPFAAPLQEIYFPSYFTNKDYPNLIPEGQKVRTTAIPTVMIIYNWKKGTERYQKVKTFVEAFFKNIDQFRHSSRHPKWKDVSITAKLPGWTRFKPAEEMLYHMKNNKLSKNRVDFNNFLKGLEAERGKKLT